MIVTLVITGEDSAALEALDVLRQLPDTEIRVSYCPPSVAEWFECPFVRDDKGQVFFGLDSINLFVSERLSERHAF